MEGSTALSAFGLHVVFIKTTEIADIGAKTAVSGRKPGDKSGFPQIALAIAKYCAIMLTVSKDSCFCEQEVGRVSPDPGSRNVNKRRTHPARL